MAVSLLLGGLLLQGCASSMGGAAGHGEAAKLAKELASEPSVCRDYRHRYVKGFRLNVRGLSQKDEAMQAKAQSLFDESRSLLREDGMEKKACSRPYCIIEPLQAGKLDSWCGYRMPTDNGPELYQWVEWDRVEF